ncbi:HK97 gp10 family phage protein [Lactiplantibacillus plantarum]|uniref:HK97 gp10 family phage protein n=1 Tax=Lactiplantibacillus plantarum TaxID=1590 RepID=UPI0018EDAE34|nr:HK97 gp10 family phage protein [Lactiplantibacillus plantarum]UNF76217.1 HK97 gp10 family phage protein [Lactiplantibacillus plantarum]
MTEVTVKFKGVDEVINKLAEKFSPAKLSRIENDALRVAGRRVAVELKNAVASYRDTGQTVLQVSVGNPHSRGGVRTIKIGWHAGSRWRLVHLNELGYTRFGKTYHPRGMGKVQGAFDSSRGPAKALEEAELRKLL